MSYTLFHSSMEGIVNMPIEEAFEKVKKARDWTVSKIYSAECMYEVSLYEVMMMYLTEADKLPKYIEKEPWRVTIENSPPKVFSTNVARIVMYQDDLVRLDIDIFRNEPSKTVPSKYECYLFGSRVNCVDDAIKLLDSEQAARIRDMKIIALAMDGKFSEHFTYEIKELSNGTKMLTPLYKTGKITARARKEENSKNTK